MCGTRFGRNKLHEVHIHTEPKLEPKLSLTVSVHSAFFLNLPTPRPLIQILFHPLVELDRRKQPFGAYLHKPYSLCCLFTGQSLKKMRRLGGIPNLI